MVKNINKIEKLGSFYASDFHFEMIILPYLNKQLKSNNNVIILTQNNLKDSIQELVSKINLEKSQKEKILKLNWENNDNEKLKFIKKSINSNQNTTLFVKGSENYINNMNEKIENLENEGNIKIINCYNLEDLGENFTSIMGKYKKILNTSGEKEIENL